MEYDYINNCETPVMMSREEMIMQIKELAFAVTDIALYLDTHPEDQRAICLHKEYTNELKRVKDAYQKIYGPLSIYFPCNKWRWVEEPWGALRLEVIYLSIETVRTSMINNTCKR